MIIAINTLFNKYNVADEIKPNILERFLEEYLLSLSDLQVFEMIYLESQRFDFTDISEERKEDFMKFLMEDRRYINKSIKRLLELGLLDNTLYDKTKGTIANILLASPKDPNAIEIDPENETPEYLQSIEKQKAEITALNERIEKLKKKIKITCVKGETLKNKRNNMCGFITIYPNKEIKKECTIVEIHEEEKKPEPEPEPIKPVTQEETQNEEKNENNEANENNENENLNEGLIEESQNNQEETNKQDGEDKQDIAAVSNRSEHIESQTVENKEAIPEEEKPKRNYCLTLAEPIITNFEYLNEATLFKNETLSTDVYVVHRDMTDYFKLPLIKHLNATLKKFSIKPELTEAFDAVKKEYNLLADALINDIKENENFKGGKLINMDIVPPEVKTEENENIEILNNQNS
jgi:hypothetical protein